MHPEVETFQLAADSYRQDQFMQGDAERMRARILEPLAALSLQDAQTLTHTVQKRIFEETPFFNILYTREDMAYVTYGFYTILGRHIPVVWKSPDVASCDLAHYNPDTHTIHTSHTPPSFQEVLIGLSYGVLPPAHETCVHESFHARTTDAPSPVNPIFYERLAALDETFAHTTTWDFDHKSAIFFAKTVADMHKFDAVIDHLYELLFRIDSQVTLRTILHNALHASGTRDGINIPVFQKELLTLLPQTERLWQSIADITHEHTSEISRFYTYTMAATREIRELMALGATIQDIANLIVLNGDSWGEMPYTGGYTALEHAIDNLLTHRGMNRSDLHQLTDINHLYRRAIRRHASVAALNTYTDALR